MLAAVPSYDAMVCPHPLRIHQQEALAAFEAARRPAAERLLEVARQSGIWYERFRDALPLDPLPFAHAYLTRGGRISPERLRERSPRFAAALESYRAAHGEVPG